MVPERHSRYCSTHVIEKYEPMKAMKNDKRIIFASYSVRIFKFQVGEILEEGFIDHRS